MNEVEMDGPSLERVQPKLISISNRLNESVYEYNELAFALKRKLDELFGSRVEKDSQPAIEKEPSCYVESIENKINEIQRINMVLDSELDRLNQMI